MIFELEMRELMDSGYRIQDTGYVNSVQVSVNTGNVHSAYMNFNVNSDNST